VKADTPAAPATLPPPTDPAPAQQVVPVSLDAVF